MSFLKDSGFFLLSLYSTDVYLFFFFDVYIYTLYVIIIRKNHNKGNCLCVIIHTCIHIVFLGMNDTY